MAMAVPRATTGAYAAGLTGPPKTTDSLPSGSWGFGPINIQWSIKDNDEIDVKVSVLGVDIDSLTGTMSANAVTLSDTLNVLNIVKGTLTLTAKFNQGPANDGLWISGQISAFGWDSGQMNHRIIPW